MPPKKKFKKFKGIKKISEQLEDPDIIVMDNKTTITTNEVVIENGMVIIRNKDDSE